MRVEMSCRPDRLLLIQGHLCGSRSAPMSRSFELWADPYELLILVPKHQWPTQQNVEFEVDAIASKYWFHPPQQKKHVTHWSRVRLKYWLYTVISAIISGGIWPTHIWEPMRLNSLRNNLTVVWGVDWNSSIIYHVVLWEVRGHDLESEQSQLTSLLMSGWKWTFWGWFLGPIIGISGRVSWKQIRESSLLSQS